MPSWAKLHTDILGDPKLMRAARKGAKGLELLPWLIAFAKQADDEGALTVGGEPAEPVDIAELLPGISAKSVAKALDSLEKIGILVRNSRNSLEFARWNERSGTAPSADRAAVRQRVAKHRARKSLQGTNDVTTGNALHPASDVTTCNAIEEKRGEEKRVRLSDDRERSPVRAVPGFDVAWKRYPSRAGGNPRRAAERAWAARVAAGVTPADLLAGVERYRAYCEREGQIGTRFVLQAATFFGPDERFAEEWAITAGNGHPPPAGGNGPPPIAQLVTALAIEYDLTTYDPSDWTERMDRALADPRVGDRRDEVGAAIHTAKPWTLASAGGFLARDIAARLAPLRAS